jgi:hypothetical protein
MPDQPIMQFTGLLDRHGVEIFEGDILHQFKRPTAPMADNGIDLITLVEDIRQIEFHSEYSEVIGNVFENPELLN